MATHSSVLAWRIPGTGEPGGLPSMGSHRVTHDWSNLAAAAAAGLNFGYTKPLKLRWSHFYNCFFSPSGHCPWSKSYLASQTLCTRSKIPSELTLLTSPAQWSMIFFNNRFPDKYLLNSWRIMAMRLIPLFNTYLGVFSLVQFSCSVMSHSLRPPWTAACQASLSITISRSLLKLMSIESVMPSSHPTCN